MSLVGNYNVFNKSPQRWLAGSTTSAEGQVRSAFNKSGANRNRFYQDGTTAAKKTMAVPTGSYMGSSWVLPQVAGEIATSGVRGSGTITPSVIAGGVNGVAALTGSGTITPNAAQLLIWAIASISGSGTISSAAGVPVAVAAANLIGAGTITSSALVGQINAIASLVGSGTITDAAGIVLSTAAIAASLSGSGVISAAVFNAIAVAQASTSGSGTVSSANGVSTFPATANLAGSGSVTSANANGAGWAVATLSGSGATISAIATALGTMSATILAYSDLTPEGIRDKVWAAPLESGLSATELMRLIAAASQGNATGLENGNPSFKSIDGTKTRINATYDAGTRVVTSRDAT
jgi:hypothetical protein